MKENEINNIINMYNIFYKHELDLDKIKQEIGSMMYILYEYGIYDSTFRMNDFSYYYFDKKIIDKKAFKKLKSNNQEALDFLFKIRKIIEEHCNKMDYNVEEFIRVLANTLYLRNIYEEADDNIDLYTYLSKKYEVIPDNYQEYLSLRTFISNYLYLNMNHKHGKVMQENSKNYVLKRR